MNFTLIVLFTRSFILGINLIKKMTTYCLNLVNKNIIKNKSKFYFIISKYLVKRYYGRQ
jgi:hypothetical protein